MSTLVHLISLEIKSVICEELKCMIQLVHLISLEKKYGV